MGQYLLEHEDWWYYDNLVGNDEYDWYPAGRGNNKYDMIDFHVDLGAGKLPKGRLTIDRHGDCDIAMDLNTLEVLDCPLNGYRDSYYYENVLPFPSNSIKSYISHHCLEHIGDGFLRLMDEVYRTLEPGGIFRIIVPLYPSLAAVSDPDHVRYFCEDTFESFCGSEKTPFWSDVFAESYTKCRFKLVDKVVTPPDKFKAEELIDIDKLVKKPREIRVALQK